MTRDDAGALILVIGFAMIAGALIALAFGVAFFKGERYAVIGFVGLGGLLGFLWGPILFNSITGNKTTIFESTTQAPQTDVPLVVHVGDQVYSRTHCGLDEEGWRDLAGVIVRAGYRFTVQIMRSAYGYNEGYELYNQVKPALISGGLLAEKGGGGVDVTELGRRAFNRLYSPTPQGQMYA